MNRADITELHYITMMLNVSSILKRGILCYREVQRHEHHSVAMPEIQIRRAKKRVPGGLHLHDYANLYFCARNPMLFKRKDSHMDLCVLRVSLDVLDLAGVVVTDGNAASDYTGYWPSPAGLDKVDKIRVFAEYWTDQDQISAWQKKSIKCAEVLVPKCVDARYITGAYVSCEEAKQSLGRFAPDMNVTIDAHLFFR
jgi:hypothetical protein